MISYWSSVNGNLEWKETNQIQFSSWPVGYAIWSMQSLLDSVNGWHPSRWTQPSGVSVLDRHPSLVPNARHHQVSLALMKHYKPLTSLPAIGHYFHPLPAAIHEASLTIHGESLWYFRNSPSANIWAARWRYPGWWFSLTCLGRQEMVAERISIKGPLHTFTGFRGTKPSIYIQSPVHQSISNRITGQK